MANNVRTTEMRENFFSLAIIQWFIVEVLNNDLLAEICWLKEARK